jgi:hypothetical protein
MGTAVFTSMFQTYFLAIRSMLNPIGNSPPVLDLGDIPRTEIEARSDDPDAVYDHLGLDAVDLGCLEAFLQGFLVPAVRLDSAFVCACGLPSLFAFLVPTTKISWSWCS